MDDDHNEEIDENLRGSDDEEDEEGYDNNNNDEEAAEGEHPIAPRMEPSEARINSLLFRDICLRLEMISGPKGRKRSDEQKLDYLVPAKMLKALDEASREPGARPETLFPLYRLLLPDMDTRRFNMGEGKIADMYMTTLMLAPTSAKAKMLYNYADPQFVTKAQGQSDLSSVIKYVVQDHKGIPENAKQHMVVGSDWTIGEINQMLDEFVRLPLRHKKAKDQLLRKNVESPTKKKQKPRTLRDIQSDWLRTLYNDGEEKKALSPIEHKWLVRILLKKQMKFGLGWSKLLAWLHPHAPMAYTAKNNLRAVCNDYCNPEIRRQIGTITALPNTALVSYLQPSPVVPNFGSIFTPMLSEKTGFDRILDDISRRHREFLKSEEGMKRFPKDKPLALMHPAFVIEPKMDGERMLAHISRDGMVRMHTRNGNWYSNFYSPVLGPPLRRAVTKNMDVILDGEVIAWDSHRQETVPFGNNRGIAVIRRQYLASQGLLDDRDKDVHKDDSEGPFMRPSQVDRGDMDDDQAMAGSECWLQFVIFDIVYLQGDGAAELLQKTVSPHLTDSIVPGCLTNLDLFERKKLLYKVLEPQKDEVEIIQAWVVRPNGGSVLGSEYFGHENVLMECGHPVISLDSQSNVLSGTIADLQTADHERRHNLTDDQISQERALSIQHLYDDMVERQRLEGLIFKDLSTPYFLGQESKSLRYWLKFKPDYYNGSVASDLDLAVVGGYFATGLQHGGSGDRAGKPSALLVACVDSMDPERFFPMCKVSVGSMDYESRNAFFKATGFSSSEDSEERSESKWFRLDKKAKETPDFITNRSFQPDQDGQGWRVPKKEYPDEWIHPDDCPVLTLNAGEVVVSDTFSAGLTLRFPRVTKVRTGADRKSASDVETEHNLWKIYQEIISSRSSSNALTSSSQPMMGSQPDSGIDSRGVQSCRFLTERQHAEKRRTSKRRVGTKEKLSVAMPDQKLQGVSSQCLSGLKFAVLGNRFHFDEKSDEFELAKEQGWSDEARKVRSGQDIKNFIVKHGGICLVNPEAECTFVIGNSEHDPKVETHIRAIQNARAALNPGSRTKKAERNAMLAVSPGVVRWSFLFSLVYRCMNEFDGKRPDDRGILNVSVLDYLSRPEGLEADSTLFEIEITTSYHMQRALDLIGKSSGMNSATALSSWWEETIQLPPEGRWVASCGFEPFWPFQKGKPLKPPMVVYPDIFESCGFLSKDEALISNEDARWGERCIPEDSAITSILPLVRIMGAMVTYHFHNGVTHVITGKVSYTKPAQDFSMECGSLAPMLVERLSNIGADSPILFVSPRWIGQLWDEASP